MPSWADRANGGLLKKDLGFREIKRKYESGTNSPVWPARGRGHRRPVTTNPDKGELLVGVKAAGVGPWDALIREGKSKVSPRRPLTLDLDLSGVVEKVGPGVSDFCVGDEVYGVTNAQFCGAHAQFALASAEMVARKPRRLNHLEAASVPVVAVTAWQTLFEYAKVVAGQSVLILGAGGNIGAYAVQLAASIGLDIVAIVGPKDVELVRNLGAKTVLVDEKKIPQADVVIDTVGGETLEHSFGKVKSGGVLVSIVSTKPLPQRPGVRSVFFYADVTTARLNVLTKLFEEEKLSVRVGSILPRTAHYMLAGAPHKPGKIILDMANLRCCSSARLLLFACSCAFSDSATLPSQNI